MSKLRPNYIISGVIATGQTTITLPLNHSDYENVWVIEQLGIFYNKTTDAPSVSLIYNGDSISGPAQMIPAGAGGVGQSFGGDPYIYAEASDDVHIFVANGSAGALVTVQMQYRIIPYSSDELAGRM